MEFFIACLIVAVMVATIWFLFRACPKIPAMSNLTREYVKALESAAQFEKEIEKKKCCALCKYYYTQPAQYGYYDEEFCRRFPEKTKTRDKHWCGEFELDEKLYYEKVAEDYCTNPFRSEK